MGILSGFVSFFTKRPVEALRVDSIKQNAEIIQDAVRSSIYLPASRHETFELAMARLRLTDAKLARRRRELQFEARGFYLLFAVSMVVFIYFGLTVSFYGMFGSACTMLIGFSGGLTRAFRVAQIDRRELFGFESFLAAPEEWWK